MRSSAPRTAAPVQAKAASSPFAATARRPGTELRPQGERPATRAVGPNAGPSFADVPIHARPARTTCPAGLPEPLKSGVERLSGFAMDDVRVHRDSPEPARLGALAFARGSDIHLGPGHERHLPHEAWHVVQQKQGRVEGRLSMEGVSLNRDESLETEADLAASRLSNGAACGYPTTLSSATARTAVAQPKLFMGSTELVETDGMSPVIVRYIKEKGNFWLNENDTDLAAPAPEIHVIAEKARYLIGETHDELGDILKTSRWEKQISGWGAIDKMTEYVKTMPPGDYSAFSLSLTGQSRQALPLESMNEYLVGRIALAHVKLNALAPDKSLAKDDPVDTESDAKDEIASDPARPLGKSRGDWRETCEEAIRSLREIQKACADYLPFADAALAKGIDPGGRYGLIKALAGDMKSRYLPKVEKLEELVEAYRYAPVHKSNPEAKTKTAPEIHAEIGKEKGILQEISTRVMVLISSSLEERLTLKALLSSDKPKHGEYAFGATDGLRERAMIARIKSTRSPLLVQIGNAHVHDVAKNVANAVAVPVGSELETETRQTQ